MNTVHDLASACGAIDRIIEQGEGSRRRHEKSHYERFRAIREEFRQLVADRHDFEPAHPVVDNPVMNKPADPAVAAHVSVPEAARVLDITNACYGLMVQLLATFFGAMEERDARGLLIGAALSLMSRAISPLAEFLTGLPYSTSDPGQTAGLSFALPRSTHALRHRDAAWRMFEERASLIAKACSRSGDRTMTGVGVALQELAATFATVRTS